MTFFVFEILDSSGAVRFVGMGERRKIPDPWKVFGDPSPLVEFFGASDPWEFSAGYLGEHPAEAIWRLRTSRVKSELQGWLKSLDEMPEYRTIAGPLERAEAKTVHRQTRRQLIADGVKLLSARPIIKLLPDPKPVWHPDHGSFRSVRAAAKHVGLTSSLISRHCKAERFGWQYGPTKES